MDTQVKNAHKKKAVDKGKLDQQLLNVQQLSQQLVERLIRDSYQQLKSHTAVMDGKRNVRPGGMFAPERSPRSVRPGGMFPPGMFAPECSPRGKSFASDFDCFSKYQYYF